jgi:hypothetical protein
VAAVGRAGLVTKDYVKPGATVIDVGMNRVTDPAIALQLFPPGHAKLALFQSKGSVLVGDVHPEVADVAGALTPVPGGVGPLTITMLMMNTLRAAQARVEYFYDLPSGVFVRAVGPDRVVGTPNLLLGRELSRDPLSRVLLTERIPRHHAAKLFLRSASRRHHDVKVLLAPCFIEQWNHRDGDLVILSIC